MEMEYKWYCPLTAFWSNKKDKKISTNKKKNAHRFKEIYVIGNFWGVDKLISVNVPI